MKKIFILLVLFLTTLELTVSGQRRKAVQFDSDISVQPSAGRFGISAYNGQPYWMTSNEEWWRIETKPTHIPVWSIGSDRQDTLDFYSHLVTIWFDDTEVWFPPRDSIPDDWYYHFTYHGIDTDTINFESIDNNQTVYFPDTIWVFTEANATWISSNFMSHNHPNKNFQIKEHSHFQTYFIRPINRWVLQRKEWYEYDY